MREAKGLKKKCFPVWYVKVRDAMGGEIFYKEEFQAKQKRKG